MDDSHASWAWRSMPVGYFEFCPCACGLTLTQIKDLGLEKDRHTPNNIAKKRLSSDDWIIKNI